MIVEYIKQRSVFLTNDINVLAIEQPFIVPIYPDNMDILYCGRKDKVIEWRGSIWVVDHKTNSSYSKAQGFQASFTDSFSPDNQIDGYAYTATMLHGDKFKGILIDAALVNKTHHDVFGLIPVERHSSHLEPWLAETRAEIELIELQKAHLEADEKWDPRLPMSQFGKNTGACYNWNTPCAYMDVCQMFPNPSVIEMPSQYIEEEWTPFNEEQLKWLEGMV
jgi:hypothetical protein